MENIVIDNKIKTKLEILEINSSHFKKTKENKPANGNNKTFLAPLPDTKDKRYGNLPQDNAVPNEISLPHNKNNIKIKVYEYTPAPGWSYFRNMLFRECHRKYWFHYYGLRYGDAQISREVKKLRNLTSLPLEIGNAVHKTIAQSLKNAITRNEYPSKEKLIIDGSETFERQLENKHFFEKDLANGLDEKRLSNALGRMEEAFATFECHPLLPEIISSLTERPELCVIDPAGYGEYRIEKKKAYAKPDLVYQNREGQTKIIDWKTGKQNGAETLIQLGGYLFYTVDVLNRPVDKLEGRMIYLSQSQDDLILKPSKGRIEMIKNRILREIGEIEEYCIDPDNNVPKPREYFSKTTDPHRCSFCKFKHICHEYT